MRVFAMGLPLRPTNTPRAVTPALDWDLAVWPPQKYVAIAASRMMRTEVGLIDPPAPFWGQLIVFGAKSYHVPSRPARGYLFGLSELTARQPISDILSKHVPHSDWLVRGFFFGRSLGSTQPRLLPVSLRPWQPGLVYGRGRLMAGGHRGRC